MRLREQLRANLNRRKAQSRGRAKENASDRPLDENKSENHPQDTNDES